MADCPDAHRPASRGRMWAGEAAPQEGWSRVQGGSAKWAGWTQPGAGRGAVGAGGPDNGNTFTVVATGTAGTACTAPPRSPHPGFLPPPMNDRGLLVLSARLTGYNFGRTRTHPPRFLALPG